jgi:hypothetical protein
MKLIHVDGELYDPLGSPFMTWKVANSGPPLFEEACAQQRVDTLYVRYMEHRTNSFYARFTAYRDGDCVSAEVCSFVGGEK